MFAHATTRSLSYPVERFVVIIWLEFGWVQDEISAKFELQDNIVNEMGPSDISLWTNLHWQQKASEIQHSVSEQNWMPWLQTVELLVIWSP